MSIASIELPDSVTAIQSNAFKDCTNLSTVSIGTESSLASIGEYAFYNCTALTSIYIPREVTLIGKYAFYGAGITTAEFAAPTNWNLTTYLSSPTAQSAGKSGYMHLSPTNATNAAAALSGEYESYGGSAFYSRDWERSNSYANGTMVGYYDVEL